MIFRTKIDTKGWPWWAKFISLFRNKKDFGVGSTIERWLRWLYIGTFYKNWYKRTFDCSCGCQWREDCINKKFNYKGINMSENKEINTEFLGDKVVVELYNKNCPHCIKMAPIIAELSFEMKDYKFIRIDGDNRADLRQKYSINTSPSYLIFNNGILVGKFVGSSSKEEFIQRIKNPVLDTSKKLYELSNSQITKLVSFINQAKIGGNEAEFIVELKQSLGKSIEK